MGLFSRKNSKISVDNMSTSSSPNVQSPRSLKTPATPGFSNFSFPSPDLPKPPDPDIDPAAYLRSIYSVRERTRLVYKKAQTNQLNHFDVDMAKFRETAEYVVSIIKRDYAPDYTSIPPHGRWQHFDVGGRPRVDQLLASWPLKIDAQERTRRLIDLFLVSVLLDAGAGTKWAYKSKENGRLYRRSEGLAVASLEMFKVGAFSSDPEQPFRVDGTALKGLSAQALAKGLQVTDDNPMPGVEGRAGLLVRLGQALENKTYFGPNARPGNMLDYLLSHPSTSASSIPIVPMPVLWDVLMNGLGAIWPPSRVAISGVSLGDSWPCSSMPSGPQYQPWESIAPFHKLTQWLAYSLVTPMAKLMHIHFAGSELLTGLPEYRNGGLLVDTGLITLKPADMERGLKAYKANSAVKGQPSMEVIPLFKPEDDVIVEWRAVTVGFLDDLLVEVNRQLGLEGKSELSLAQMLEAGSWKAGRELAEVSRPNTKEPPIMIHSDGTLF